MLIKSQTIYTSSVLIAACFKADNIEPALIDNFVTSMAQYRLRINFRSTEFFRMFYQLNYYLAKNIDYPEVDLSNRKAPTNIGRFL